MKYFIIFLGIVLFLHMPVVFSQEASESHKAFYQAYAKGMERGDMELFKGSFADDIKIMPEYDKSYLGMAAAKDYFKSLFELYDIVKYKRTILEVVELGERTLLIGNFEVSFKKHSEGEPISLPGTWFDVWDSSSSKPKLITLAWNYDKRLEGMENIFRAKSAEGVHYAFQPTISLESDAAKELLAFRQENKAIMMAKPNPKIYAAQYSQDAWLAQHDKPLIYGRKAIEEFFVDYTNHGSTFEYLDVNTHDLYVHNNYMLVHGSYNLRWRNGDYSGIVMGKGVRLFTYNLDGDLKALKTISLHD